MKTIVVALALCVVGCGTTSKLDCPETEPVIIHVPTPVPDSTAAHLLNFLTSQQTPTTLDGLGETNSTIEIATESLLENYYWRSLFRDVKDLLRSLAPVTDSEGNPLFN